MAVSHWHVTTGIRGYGPDDPGPAMDLMTAASMASDEASYIADFCWESFYILKDSEMWEDAVHAVDDALDFETLAQNFDFSETGRSKAPLFQGEGGAERMEESIKWLSNGSPWEYDNGRLALYMWECDSDDCDDDGSE